MIERPSNLSSVLYEGPGSGHAGGPRVDPVRTSADPFFDLPVHSNGQVVPAHQAADLFAAVRRHWPIVLAIVTVALVGAVVVTASAVKQYDATAKVLLTSGEPVEQIRSAGSRPLDSERDVNTSVELVSVESVAKSVRDELKLPDSVAALQARVRATLEGNSNVLAITVRD